MKKKSKAVDGSDESDNEDKPPAVEPKPQKPQPAPKPKGTYTGIRHQLSRTLKTLSKIISLRFLFEFGTWFFYLRLLVWNGREVLAH
jgi:hypothetical protein